MNADSLATRIKESIAAHAARELAWLPHDRRGRWVVIEPGAGRYLKHSSKEVRRIADAYSQRRARRFSSLSQARKFARAVWGTVRRWRRTPPGGGQWRRQSPWERAVNTAGAVFPLLGFK